MQAITYHNYFSTSLKEAETIESNATLKKGHAFFKKVTKNGTSYTGLDQNEAVKRVVLKHIDLLNQTIEGKQKSSGSAKKSTGTSKPALKAKVEPKITYKKAKVIPSRSGHKTQEN